MLKINNKVLKINGDWLNASSPEPPTPSLPPYTLRLRFKDGVTPSFSKGTGVQVSSSPNIWDLTYENADWSRLLRQQTYLLEVIGANTSNVTDMSYMFDSCILLTIVPLFDTSTVTNMYRMFNACRALPTVPLFDTSNVTNMNGIFVSCSALTYIPLFNTSNVISMNSAFQECYNVEYGALALYQQASSQANVPSHDSWTFLRCGRDTATGAAELAQIPSSWGGTGT